MDQITRTIRRSDQFNVMVYVKFTKKENIKDFVNIDWTTVDLKVTQHVDSTQDFIDVTVNQKLNSECIHMYDDLYYIKGKSTQGDDLVILFSNKGTDFNVIGKSPIIQLNDNLYYTSFLYFRKMLEVSLVNIDKLPQNELETLYNAQIYKLAQNKLSQKELAINITQKHNYNDKGYKTFWYQDENDPTKLIFGRFYFNKILSIFERNLEYNYLIVRNPTKYHNFNLFNSYFTKELTRDEFKNLAYLQGYNGKVQPYNFIYHNRNKIYIMEDSIENRIKAHLLNNVFNSSPYYYDYEGDKHLYTFHTNSSGNITIENISGSAYELKDIINCL